MANETKQARLRSSRGWGWLHTIFKQNRQTLQVPSLNKTQWTVTIVSRSVSNQLCHVASRDFPGFRLWQGTGRGGRWELFTSGQCLPKCKPPTSPGARMNRQWNGKKHIGQWVRWPRAWDPPSFQAVPAFMPLSPTWALPPGLRTRKRCRGMGCYAGMRVGSGGWDRLGGA